RKTYREFRKAAHLQPAAGLSQICRVVPACKRARTRHHQRRWKPGKCENESLLELDVPQTKRGPHHRDSLLDGTS
ncbi:hypothetical protein M405DRAFT_808874, partial [Rhizopogon salebrosus TDB-379]